LATYHNKTPVKDFQSQDSKSKLFYTPKKQPQNQLSRKDYRKTRKKLTQENNLEDQEILPGVSENDNDIIEKLVSFLYEPEKNEIVKQHLEKLEEAKKSLEQNSGKQLRGGKKDQIRSGLHDKVNELEKQYEEFTSFTSECLKELDKLEEMRKKFPNLENISYWKESIRNLLKRIRLELNRLESALPIYARKSDIIKKLKSDQVILVIGETGSGKSTQIPQYLLEVPEFKGKIACVQPRRLATITVAKRVAEELGEKDTGLVSYQVRSNDRNNNPKTKIRFMTDRILLNEMFDDPDLSRYSCILVDEAHERNINTDILLGMLKETIKRNPKLRLIVHRLHWMKSFLKIISIVQYLKFQVGCFLSQSSICLLTIRQLL